MTEKTSKGDCFIIMPISTPNPDVYGGDKQHFEHVLECLLVPAVEKAGFNPVRPVSKGSDIIQADIIKNLAEADLVLCDMSILNANVFYELGIRTALDKPIALISDDQLGKIPFDMAILNCKAYRADLKSWELGEDIKLLAKHISDAYEKAEGGNSMWKYFGVAQAGEFNPGSVNITDKVDYLTQEVIAMRSERKRDNKERKLIDNIARQYGGVNKPTPAWLKSREFGMYNLAFKCIPNKDKEAFSEKIAMLSEKIGGDDKESIVDIVEQVIFPAIKNIDVDRRDFSQWIVSNGLL